ncbi:GNAT family N-acetyltransferase [Algoriphagus kandeliae]|uniref:GNAT family N-acetyltransferase n=1 Tax=Algoriphagus kandeliae TaxID=2562278 RepID=A0A4Y9R0W6_9BACT|nr:GNAT family N-acetyltransferase [Algoriphagus kandeliae]TFV97502.1 GNAT family N-acetyltransferase [Algoriphagus kandeliae]
MNLTHTVKAFSELTLDELYDLLRLRSEVFVVEQNCVFLDMDNKDQKCHHVLLNLDNELVGYCRIVPAGLSYQEVAIGRVVTAPSVRGKGFGRKVMELGIEACQNLYGPCDIRLGAQTYALGFYESLGFQAEGGVYDEDGIEHIEMVKRV